MTEFLTLCCTTGSIAGVSLSLFVQRPNVLAKSYMKTQKPLPIFATSFGDGFFNLI